MNGKLCDCRRRFQPMPWEKPWQEGFATEQKFPGVGICSDFGGPGDGIGGSGRKNWMCRPAAERIFLI